MLLRTRLLSLGLVLALAFLLLVTVHILDDINQSIQRYMFMLLATNVLVGLLTWIALRRIGLENAGVWGMLLSMPITVLVKVVAQHVEQLEPVAELPGD